MTGPRARLAGWAAVLVLALAWPGGAATAHGAEVPVVQAPPLVAHEAERVLDAGELGRPSSLEVGRDGRLWAAYPMEGVVRVVDPDLGIVAEHEVPAALRPGSPWRIGWVGDTLWVMGRRGADVVFLDADGRLLRTTGLTLPSVAGEAEPFRPLSMLPRDEALVSTTGSALAMAAANLDQDERAGVRDGAGDGAVGRLLRVAPLRRLPLWRVTSHGEIVDTVLWLSTRNRAAVLLPPEGAPGDRRFVLAAQPFADDPLLDVDPTGRHVVVVERGIASNDAEPSFELVRLTAEGDTMFTRTYRIEPVAMRPEWVEAAVRREAERVSADPAADLAEGAEVARQGLFLPAWLPPVSTVKVGPDGWVWLRREAVPDALHAYWELVNPAGDRVGRIRLPASWRVRSVAGAEAWATEPAGDGGAHLWHVRVGVGEVAVGKGG